MMRKLTNRSISTLVLGGWTGLVSALSLGPVTGSAVVGWPLDLTVQIQFDGMTERGSTDCVSAEVFYGDRSRAKVTVDLTTDAARQVAYARITSATLLDEPFVTMVLQAGCGTQSTRRYVVLAEAFKEGPAILAPTPALAMAAATRLAPVLPESRPAQRVRAAPSPMAARPSIDVAAVTPPVLRAAPGVQRGVTSPRGRMGGDGGKLQLALWDPSAEQLPWLRTSMELKSAPSADTAQRAAAAALWRALNAQPQDLLRTADRLRGLEGELGTLRRRSESHRLEIVAASESLQGSRGQRWSSLLLVTLLALLAGGGAAFFWHRSRREGAAVQADSWYGPLEPRAEPELVVEEELQPLPGSATPSTVEPPEPFRVPKVVVPKAIIPAVPLAPPPVEAPLLGPLEFLLPDATATPAPAAQIYDPSGLKVDTLHGVQQQAEFFASLGQVDEAVAVLASYLKESSEKPPLAFLELFRIYQGTGMRMQFEELQSTFRQTFGMDVPSFGEYGQEQRELELFPIAMIRIVATWPSVQGQEVIEELLFKKPATPRELLSLEAYRELLWLYELGQEIVHRAGTQTGLQLRGDQGVTNDLFVLPWAQGEENGPEQLSLDRLADIDVATELNAFGLDIDLTAMRSDAAPLAPEDALQDPVPQAAPAPTPAPAPAPASDVDAFDAVMDSLSRRK